MGLLYDALVARSRTTPGSPLVTWYGPDGARTELSTVTFLTATAKTASALREEWDIPVGTAIRLSLPLHWQLPVWLAACDLAGLDVDFGSGPVGAVVSDDAAVLRAFACDHAILTPTTAFGLPGAPPPDPILDHARDAMGQPDVYLGDPASGSWLVAPDTRWDDRDLVVQARREAEVGGVTAGDRALVTPGSDAVRTALAVWAVPLLTDSSVVLCPTELADRVSESERTTSHRTGGEP